MKKMSFQKLQEISKQKIEPLHDILNKDLPHIKSLISMCPNSNTDLYNQLSLEIGCARGGFGLECANCCALPHVIKHAGKNTPYGRLCSQVIDKFDGKWGWNGKIVKNIRALKYFSYNPKIRQKQLILTYTGDCALWSQESINLGLSLSTEAPKHQYLWLSKIPNLLMKKVKVAIKDLLIKGIDIRKNKNLVFATSSGSNETSNRVDQIRKFKDLGLLTGVFIKPLISLYDEIDLRNIDILRLNFEKGKRKRPWLASWTEPVLINAKENKVKVFLDMKKEVLLKKRDEYISILRNRDKTGKITKKMLKDYDPLIV